MKTSLLPYKSSSFVHTNRTKSQISGLMRALIEFHGRQIAVNKPNKLHCADTLEKPKRTITYKKRTPKMNSSPNQ